MTLAKKGKIATLFFILGSLNSLFFKKFRSLSSHGHTYPADPQIKPTAIKHLYFLFHQRNTVEAFTLTELMVATLILGLVLVGLLASYVACMDLTELAKNTSIGINLAQTKMEEIKNSTFAQIKTNYNNIPFDVSGLDGKGVSYVDDTNPDLLRITATVSWKQKNNRVIGEDANLNGVLDSGEDQNANNQLDSVAQVVTYIVKP